VAIYSYSSKYSLTKGEIKKKFNQNVFSFLERSQIKYWRRKKGNCSKENIFTFVSGSKVPLA